MKKLRVVFFGTPQLSADTLTYLIKDDSCDIVGVVSSPDTTGGRWHTVIQSPVTLVAHKHSLTLSQPENIRTNEIFLQAMRNLRPDICLVVAYGKILPQVLLDIPPMGFLNVHTSLLPKYRGAAPIQHALLNGEKQTGLTVMQMSLGMDEGDILLQEVWPITPDDTTGSLFQRTGERAGPLLIKALKGLQNGTITPQKQDTTQATYTTMIEKTDAAVHADWTLDQAYHAWQAYVPWPGLHTFFWNTKVILQQIEKYPIEHSLPPLSWHVNNKLPALAFKDGFLFIHGLTPAGKKRMSGEDFVRWFMR